MIYHHVSQKDDYGCAIGAAAMLAHVSYDVAKAAIKPSLGRTYSWRTDITEVIVTDTTTSQLLRGLRQLGLKVKSYEPPLLENYANFVRYLHCDALLTLDGGVDAFGDYEHCIAWCATRRRIYDPYDPSFNPNFHTVYNYFIAGHWRISHVIEVLSREVAKTREYSQKVKSNHIDP